MTHWGMVIDLRKCVGCETCSHVCPGANIGGWRKVIRLMIHDDPKCQSAFITMGCMHCENAPCLDVCPTGATHRRSDSIVDIDQKLCVGCGACILACPYKARKIILEDEIVKPCNEDPGEHVRKHLDRIGVCCKCNFCVDHLDEGIKNGLQPGRDFLATPLCVRNCIAEALHFGDLDDPNSDVAKLVRENRTKQLNEAAGTHPSVFYILQYAV